MPVPQRVDRATIMGMWKGKLSALEERPPSDHFQNKFVSLVNEQISSNLGEAFISRFISWEKAQVCLVCCFEILHGLPSVIGVI